MVDRGGGPSGLRLLAAAVRRAGSTAALARGLGLSPSSVSGWRKRGRVPEDRQRLLERWVEFQRVTPAPRRPGKREFEKALKRAGSYAALARELGLASSTIKRCAEKNLSAKCAEALVVAKVRKFSVEDRRAKDELRLMQLYTAGRENEERYWTQLEALIKEKKTLKTAEEKKLNRKRQEEMRRRIKLPTEVTADKEYSAPSTHGHTWTKRWGIIIDWGDLPEIEAWYKNHAGRSHRKWWQATAHIVQFDGTGRGEHLPMGYSKGYVQQELKEGDDVEEKDEGTFRNLITSGRLITPRRASRNEVADRVMVMLREAITKFTCYLVGTSIKNYHIREDKDRRQWATKKRRDRQQGKRQKKRSR